MKMGQSVGLRPYLMSYFDWKAASEELADDEKKLENIEDIVVQSEQL